ncbi:MAG: response regulator transcription factor [bacterium]|nr:response regulator transcription factor [bacterium]
MNWPARLIVIGTHCLFRECLASMLYKIGRYHVIHHTGDFQQAIERVEQNCPDVLVIDLNEPGASAVELVRGTRHHCPEVKIVILGTGTADSAILKCIEAGAGACVSKESSLRELCTVIERVLAGEAIYSPQIAYSMFARLAELSRERARSERVEALELTPREMEILQLIAEGMSNRCIAEQLSLSVYTVKNHVHHILEKLHVHDRREAVEHAHARHWLHPASPAAVGRGRLSAAGV